MEALSVHGEVRIAASNKSREELDRLWSLFILVRDGVRALKDLEQKL